MVKSSEAKGGRASTLLHPRSRRPILTQTATIEAGGHKVAEVSRKWFRVRDTYGVEVAPGQNDVVILAVTVGIDMM